MYRCRGYRRPAGPDCVRGSLAWDKLEYINLIYKYVQNMKSSRGLPARRWVVITRHGGPPVGRLSSVERKRARERAGLSVLFRRPSPWLSAAPLVSEPPQEKRNTD